MLKYPSNLTCLIVEDDPMVQQVTEEFIKKIHASISIQSAQSIQGAKEILARCPIDCVLLDLYFPESSGLDLLVWLRKEKIETDVILVTADHQTSTIEKGLRLGVVDYIVKPFRFERFKQAIDSLVVRQRDLKDKQVDNQGDVDDLIAPGREVLAEESMDHINPTYSSILKTLKANPDHYYTAQDIGELLGIARITARRYLEQLEQEDIITLKLEYGSVGRPQNYYSYKKESEE